MKKELGSQTIVFPTPVYIVGSYCGDGKPNVMNVAWGGLCSSEPPCVAVSIRKNRCIYDNIMERKAFTVHIPSEEYMKEADYFGMASGHKADKIKTTGLTVSKSSHVDAPCIEEFPLCLECKVVNVVEIGQHAQFIGEIINVIVDAACVDDDGRPDIGKINPMIFDPAANNYNAVGKVLGKAFNSGKYYL